MELSANGAATMRRGSYDDAALCLRPHLRHLAQRRRSAPSLAFGKALGIPWSPIREEASCWVTAEQSPFVLGLTSENGELLLDECVQVTEGSKTKDRHLFLFRDVIVFAKLKSNASYRLKHRVNLQDIWLYGFEDNLSDVEERGDVDLRVTLILAWALTLCWVFFCSPEVKERWLDTLHRIIDEAKARVGRCSSPPGVLMKMLSGSIPTKTLAGGGMEQFEFPLQGNAHANNRGDRSPPANETKWSLVRRLKKGPSFVSRTRHSDTDSKTQLFGQPLFKICPDELSLPKPVTEMLLLLRRKGPSTEGVFRKPCNSKIMREIREQLNNGLEVDMEAQPAVLLVGLLKSFLKELPGSLLVSDLYDNWVAALDNEDNQQRVLELKRVADKLPGPNKVLLQHLICVLHHILESADTNKMDAHNLAVCIAPTLLHLNGAPLDEQKEKIEKVTELTQFLLEHFELLGENIPNLLDTDEDSISSQHHDSAYDSTDPDGDAEGAESVSLTHRSGGSASSLNPPGFTASPWQLDLTFDPKVPFNRRCSEPIILVSPDLKGLCGHAWSHDDCSVERRSFEEQPLKKQISDDSFLLRRRGGAKSVLSFPKLTSCSYVDPLHHTGGSRIKDSCSSLESAASNQSEGSVFTSSPVGSPLSTRKTNGTNQPSGATAAEQGAARSMSDQKRRSQSMRVVTKVLLRTRSLGAFSRSSLKKDFPKENSFPCETLPEDSQSETDPPSEVLLKTRPLSAIEVFKLVDSRLPCRPPSYEHATQSTGLPPQYGSMTVHDAMERRSRPSSVNYDCSPACSVSLYTDCFNQMAQVNSSTVERQQPFRQRAMSESMSARTHEAVSRRCSQPVFEDFSYAKESYV